MSVNKQYQESMNKAFHIGFDRTQDLLCLIEDGDEGEAELVGIFVSVLYELAQRWNVTSEEAIERIQTIL